MVQHDVLFAKLFALLAGAVNANISIQAISCLILRARLLSHMSLVLGPTHIVTDQIASIIDQLLFTLLLTAVYTSSLTDVLARCILI